MVKYIPEKGDIVWLEFDPQSGHEQKGLRPALAISPKIYNEKSGLCLFVPITTKIKGYPFEVVINCDKIHGVALSDQVKSLDFVARNAKFCDKIDTKTFDRIVEKIALLIEKN